MKRIKNMPAGFTLVELLCVITILVILILMLVPYLSTARELAIRAQCVANLRSISVAAIGFAAEHNGRGPGVTQRGWAGTQVSGSGIGWSGILNAEYFRYPAIGGKLTCPLYKLYNGRLYRSPYSYNNDAAGGDFVDGNAGQWSNPTGQNLGLDPNYPHDTQYGMPVDPGQMPTSVQPYYTAIDKEYPTYNFTLAWYDLGARLTNFPRPDYTYLVIESDGWGTFDPAYVPTTIYPTQVNARPDGSQIQGPNGEPPWDALAGNSYDWYGFRHTRPAEYIRYQAQVTAGFVFVDGHLDVMNANVPDQNAKGRFAYKP